MKKEILKRIFIGFICGWFLVFDIASTGLAGSGKETAKSARLAAKRPAKRAVPDKEIIALQKALNSAGFRLKVDGIMGKRTRTALKKFQKDNGLKVTGKPDSSTMEKLGIK